MLERKILEVAHSKINLKEDFSTKAQCYVIESNFDDQQTSINATVLVKRGTLNLDDIFVCGTDEGKVRQMINDRGQLV